MKIQSICLIAGLVLAFAAPASAQSNDVAYCHALSSKYQAFLGSLGSGRHAGVDQNANGRMAVEKCNAGDTSGIPTLEQELRNAKVDLPPRS